MLGCKRESLSRAMKILQDENLVKIEGKKVYIKEGWTLQVILNQLNNKLKLST